MWNKLSIQWKLSIISAILLTACCIGLTLVLNLSAYRMADYVGMTPITIPGMGYQAPMTIFPSLPAEKVLQMKHAFSLQSTLYMLLTIVGGSTLTYYFVGKALAPLQSLN